MIVRTEKFKKEFKFYAKQFVIQNLKKNVSILEGTRIRALGFVRSIFGQQNTFELTNYKNPLQSLLFFCLLVETNKFRSIIISDSRIDQDQ